MFNDRFTQKIIEQLERIGDNLVIEYSGIISEVPLEVCYYQDGHSPCLGISFYVHVCTCVFVCDGDGNVCVEY